MTDFKDEAEKAAVELYERFVRIAPQLGMSGRFISWSDPRLTSDPISRSHAKRDSLLVQLAFESLFVDGLILPGPNLTPRKDDEPTT